MTCFSNFTGICLILHKQIAFHVTDVPIVGSEIVIGIVFGPLILGVFSIITIIIIIENTLNNCFKGIICDIFSGNNITHLVIDEQANTPTSSISTRCTVPIV
jgi:hypothetical protein